MIPQDWHKEPWIKKCTRVAFIEWCAQFQNLSAEDAGLIYDSHVLPEPDKVQVPVAKVVIPDPPEAKDKAGVFIDTELE